MSHVSSADNVRDRSSALRISGAIGRALSRGFYSGRETTGRGCTRRGDGWQSASARCTGSSRCSTKEIVLQSRVLRSTTIAGELFNGAAEREGKNVAYFPFALVIRAFSKSGMLLMDMPSTVRSIRLRSYALDQRQDNLKTARRFPRPHLRLLSSSCSKSEKSSPSPSTRWLRRDSFLPLSVSMFAKRSLLRREIIINSLK